LDIKKELIKRSLNTNTIDHLAAKAMKEDPNIFDYDGAYDQMQASKHESINRRFAVSAVEAPVSEFVLDD
jgi:hypothetical protein